MENVQDPLGIKWCRSTATGSAVQEYMFGHMGYTAGRREGDKVRMGKTVCECARVREKMREVKDVVCTRLEAQSRR